MFSANFVAIALLAGTAICVSAGPPPHHKPPHENYFNKCKEEAKLNADESIKAILMKDSNFTDNEKCFIECLGRNEGVFVDGKVVEEKVIAKINEFADLKPAGRQEKEMQVFNECKDTTGKDNCDTAAKIFACARDSAMKLGLAEKMPQKKE